MKTRTVHMVVLAAALLLGFMGPALAQDLKQRMLNRLPQIAALKAQGVVGENNKGYLEIRSGNAGKDVVDAENADRRAVYEAIAKQQGTDPRLVGERRALQIANSARPGEWVQAPDGKWYKK